MLSPGVAMLFMAMGRPSALPIMRRIAVVVPVVLVNLAPAAYERLIVIAMRQHQVVGAAPKKAVCEHMQADDYSNQMLHNHERGAASS